jgi:replicative DNA helicase
MIPKIQFQEHGKLPPQNIECEENVIGSILIESHCLHNIIGLLSPDVFYKESNQCIYEAIINLYDNNKAIDLSTVTNQLRKNNKLEIAGGAYNITMLTSRIASSANVMDYVKVIIEKFIARKLIETSTEIIRNAFDDSTDVFTLLDHAETEMSKVNEISVRGGSMSHISHATQKAKDELKLRVKSFKEGLPTGIPTGLSELDKILGGWQKSFLHILASRPGMGKTAMMLKHARSAAIAGFNVCVYSLEMSEISLANRMLLSMCEVDLFNFKRGSMNDHDWFEINNAEIELNKLPIYLDPNPNVTTRYIKSNSRLMKKKGKCDVIFIDYLQLIDSAIDGNKNRNREQEVAQASRQCVIIAKELNVPVILLAQLSRKVEDRKGNRPELSDLRESGAIEQDARVVMFLYRPEYYGVESDSAGNSSKGIGELIVAKNSEGATDDIAFRYNESLTKISDYNIEYNLSYQQEPNF